MSHVHFVALISRENRPIHVQQVSGPTDNNQLLKYHFLANMALDVLTSPSYEGENNTVQLLFVKDQANIYGYQTSTGLKIIIGTDQEIKKDSTVFSSIHKIYLNMIINPFQTEELKFNEKSLSGKISQVINQHQARTPTAPV